MTPNMKQQEYILNNDKEVLEFLKARFPLYHLSNFFFRDVQYGIQMFLAAKKMKVGYADAETIARAFVDKLEQLKIFTPIDRQSWVVNYPAFKKPVVKPPVAAKPAAPAPAAPREAAPAPASTNSATPAGAGH